MSSNLSSYFHTNMRYLKYADNDWKSLITFIKHMNEINPYNGKNKVKSAMWNEQVYVNFPILYLSCIHLYLYGKKNGCDTYLFATRDCSQMVKVFRRLFPNEKKVHYFNCSRLMFESATAVTNPVYNAYVKSLVTDTSNTIFIDIHGTGERPLNFFPKVYGKAPHIYMLSTGHTENSKMPKCSQDAIANKRFVVVVYGARGSPIEMLNYDKVGTLEDFTSIGPIRADLEYSIDTIETYHECIDTMISDERFPTDLKLQEYNLKDLVKLINKLFKVILEQKPVISDDISHVGKHKPKYIKNDMLNRITFDKIINDNGVHGMLWSGTIDKVPCAIKMVALKPEKSKKSKKRKTSKNDVPFIHELFDNKKPMNTEKFIYEATQIMKLSRLGLAPNVHTHFVCDLSEIQYGFIVMDRMDCSIKDIIVKRKVNKSEEAIIAAFIKTAHIDNKVSHGDMKPSNFGVKLSDQGTIIECRFLDCAKATFRNDMSSKKFKELCKKDIETFHSHYDKNRKHDKDSSAIMNMNEKYRHLYELTPSSDSPSSTSLFSNIPPNEPNSPPNEPNSPISSGSSSSTSIPNGKIVPPIIVQ